MSGQRTGSYPEEVAPDARALATAGSRLRPDGISWTKPRQNRLWAFERGVLRRASQGGGALRVIFRERGCCAIDGEEVISASAW